MSGSGTGGQGTKAPTTPGDLARWAFWVQGSRLLSSRHPRQMRAFCNLWPLQYLAAREGRAIMEEEFRLCFGADAVRRVPGAYRAAWRTHAEELLLQDITAANVDSYMRLDGRHHLDDALSRGKGAMILYPHAGNFMMMIACLSLHGYRYTQVAARGLAPEGVAEKNPEVFGHNRWRQEVRDRRDQIWDRIPATFYGGKKPRPHLAACLANNECVGIAFDGRVGRSFLPVPYLNRQALISPGALELAVETGTTIVPAFCICPPGAPNTTRLGPPIVAQGDPNALLRTLLQTWVEPQLHENPEGYGIWLVHCRQRRAVDDHPFFIDYAPDERWRRYLGA